MKTYLGSDGSGWKMYQASRVYQRFKNLTNHKEAKEDKLISRITSMAIRDMRNQKQTPIK